mmetsp:Transcript_15533/g.50126  ORF Transcript_15533/g.50126 Transcript_15533/m.50126 type:complete len:231 (-) Transcript_15533:1342-2034(-)
MRLPTWRAAALLAAGSAAAAVAVRALFFRWIRSRPGAARGRAPFGRRDGSAWASIRCVVAEPARSRSSATDAAAPPPAPSPRTVQAVQASWAQAEALGLATVGALFFDALFATSASAEQLFATQKFADGPAGRARFKLHTLNVMQTLSAAVYGLSDLGSLAPVLEALGESHLGYNVLHVHYEAAGAALLATLRGGLGEEFTPALESAWREVYAFIAQSMLRGASRAMYTF